MTFSIRFWGVRGSIACPSAENVRYGGNTSCIEVFIGDDRIILDAGTGIRELGKAFQRDDVRSSHILLTHTHWDHINGFPFFAPAFDPFRSFHVLSGHLRGQKTIKSVLSGQMANPMFPVPLEAMKAQLAFEDFTAGDSFTLLPGVQVRTCLLNHPNEATGYRIEYEGRSLCYITDTEHVPGRPDQNILSLIEGADLVIYDSTYTEEEFPDHIGWGHSTWNEGMRLCREAKAQHLVIFHHEPNHNDTFMDRIAAEARKAWSETTVAQEGMELSLA